jgi:hypothetical protein
MPTRGRSGCCCRTNKPPRSTLRRPPGSVDVGRAPAPRSSRADATASQKAEPPPRQRLPNGGLAGSLSPICRTWRAFESAEPRFVTFFARKRTRLKSSRETARRATYSSDRIGGGLHHRVGSRRAVSPAGLPSRSFLYSWTKPCGASCVAWTPCHVGRGGRQMPP